MAQNVGDSIKTILDFLKSIPLSESTVRDYKIRCQNILSYCDSNGIDCFSHSEAQTFINLQAIRFKNGQIGGRHLRRLRRSAFLLAECTEGKKLVWKSAVFPARVLGEYYKNVLADYKAHLFPLLAPGTIRGVLSMILHFLF